MEQISLTAPRRLPRRSRRQRLTVVGLTLAISAVFWSAIWFAHRDPDPLLYERIVPVTIVRTPAEPTGPSEQIAVPASGKQAASGTGRPR